MRGWRTWCVLVMAAVACPVAAPGSASGATAEVRYTPAYEGIKGAGSPAEEVLTVTVGAGERGDLVLAGDAAVPWVVIESRSVPLTAGRSCAPVGPNQVRCSYAVMRNFVAVSTSDGDDQVDLRGLGRRNLRVETGAGADTIWMPPGGGTAEPGPGPDVVRGGDGADAVYDGEDSGADVYELGGGRNVAGYYRASESLSFDLGQESVLGGGVRDRLVGAQIVRGSNGDDRIVGTDADEELDGGPGNDRVEGGGGADRLEGGLTGRPDHDVLIGGPGDDRLEAAPLASATMEGGPGKDVIVGYGRSDVALGGPGDDSIQTGAGSDRVDAGAGDDTVSAYGVGPRLRCGPGRDVAAMDAHTRSSLDCERVAVDEVVEVQRRVRVSRRTASFRMYCPAKVGPYGCRGRVRVQCGSVSRPRLAGRTSYRVRKGRTALLRTRLKRVGRCRRSDLRVTVVRKRPDGIGNLFERVVGWRLF